MKLVNIKNITLQFDSVENVNNETVNQVIDLVNKILSDKNLFIEPQIIKQNDTLIQVIDLIDDTEN